jgi:tRNA G18 (ribose-2'-O)-methylase SpoU
VLNKYRYWSVAAIVAELDKTRSGFHVAIENWQHDLNIGSIVRTANAFNAAGIHIIGKKDWNRRGAMVTDKYLHVYHHSDVNTFKKWAEDHALPILAIDNIEGSISLETAKLPKACIFLFGQEGPGLSDEAKDCASTLLSIQQHGSTRSMNASAAGAIVMFAWGLQHLSVD